jgi:hypothetical protein
MKWLPILFSIVFVLTAVPVLAEKPTYNAQVSTGTISPGELTPTPDMWFYEQYMRQYMDPQMAVRQKAEFRATQRDRRIASRRWFGYSNLRPTAGTDPIHNDSSAHWASNNGVYPERWTGVGPVLTVPR